MERRESCERRDSDTVKRITFSRRAVLGSSGTAVLALLTGSVPGRETPNSPEHDAATQARLDQRKAFAERMRNAGSMEERVKMIEEIRAMDRQRAIDEFRSKLGLADPEWAVVKPRTEAVYDRMHPPLGMKAGRQKTEVEQKSVEIQEVLDNNGPDAGQIKTNEWEEAVVLGNP
jgi:serine/threonine protein kinase HipA of HipAB toxin-antitoxin module